MMDIELLISQYMDGELSSEEEAELHHALALSPESRSLFREHLMLQGVARDERVLHRPTEDMRGDLFARLQSDEGMNIPAASIAGAGGIVAADVPSVVSRRAQDRPPLASEELSQTEERRRRRRLIPILVPLLFCVIAGGVWIAGGFNGSNDTNSDAMFAAHEENAQSNSRGTIPEMELRYNGHEDTERNGTLDSLVPDHQSTEELIAFNEELNEDPSLADNSRARRAIVESPVSEFAYRERANDHADVNDYANITDFASVEPQVESLDEPSVALAIERDHNRADPIAEVTRSASSDRLPDELLASGGFNVRGGRSNETSFDAEENPASLRTDVALPDSLSVVDENPALQDNMLVTFYAPSGADDGGIGPDWAADNNYGRGGIARSIADSDDSQDYLAAGLHDSLTGQRIRATEENYEEAKQMVERAMQAQGLDFETSISGSVNNAPVVTNNFIDVMASNSIPQNPELENLSTSNRNGNASALTSPSLLSGGQKKSLVPVPLGKDVLAQEEMLSETSEGSVRTAMPTSLNDMVNSRSESDQSMPLSVSGRSTYFVGIEQGIGVPITSERSAELPISSLPSSNGSISPEIRVKFGAAFGRGRHQLFAGLSSALYKKRTSYRELSTVRVLGQQTVNRITTVSREEEEDAWEFQAMAGYRYNAVMAERWQSGVETYAGVGMNYLHFGLTLPVSYQLAKRMRVEFNPGLSYRRTISKAQAVTTTKSIPGGLSSSYEEQVETPRDSHGVQAVAGIGLILLLH